MTNMKYLYILLFSVSIVTLFTKFYYYAISKIDIIRFKIADKCFTKKNKEKQATIEKFKLSSSLLSDINLKAFSDADSQKKDGNHLIETLAEFGVNCKLVNVCTGNAFTIYEIALNKGVKASSVLILKDDIALALAAKSVRIAQTENKNTLSIEVSNTERSFFSLKELIDSEEYINTNAALPLILGKDIPGKPYIADLAKMPHLLVAGTTGSGKSVCINTIIMSLLFKYSHLECKFIMIDPKLLELSAYDGIPHLFKDVVTDMSEAITSLDSAVDLMQARYKAFSQIGVRNLTNYNEHLKFTNLDHLCLPFIIIIIDEFADLMVQAKKEVETSLQRLAQMGRAAGIHIILATQRPSAEVMTGVIKANFSSRISFKVSSEVDSRIILGEQGAENLLGMGDMLYSSSDTRLRRLQAPFVRDNEVQNITKHLIKQKEKLKC